jgi:hypothetical protein
MRWLILRALALWFVLLLCSSVSLLIGRQQPPPLYLALLHLTDCEFPCWIGIVPGKTTVAEARERIIAVYGIELTRYETDKALTFVDELSLRINPTTAFEIRIEQEIDDETHDVNVRVIRDQNGIISSVLIDFYGGDHLFAQLQALVGTPMRIQALPGSQVYSLFYKGAIAKGNLHRNMDCEAHVLSLELGSTKPTISPSTFLFPWSGWRNLSKLIQCQ